MDDIKKEMEILKKKLRVVDQHAKK